jgi:4-hydroxy-3-polyprenylbenzoate decarboxylase
MGYKNLAQCVADLERYGHLKRIRDEVDPYLEMSAMHLEEFEAGGKALLFERVKGSKFPAVSNLFGDIDRARFIFRDTWTDIQKLIGLKIDPTQALKNPLKFASLLPMAVSALPKRSGSLADFEVCKISDLPQIQHWPMDGGAFVTLPAVYTEDIDKPGVMQSNLGMYRIQLSGNDYITDREIGLHYQLHRGIGVHQTKTNARGLPLKVSIFVGGPPSLIVSAVMPLPEGLSELPFAGALNRHRFRYFYDKEGFCISSDSDFTITGEVFPNENKDEGPFGDHLGYYSLKHPFPLMRVHNVYCRKGAIWPFTVVGRPPQEDTAFGALIHELTGSAVRQELPGVKEVHAVDAAGVHPLLLAIGSERYTPYLNGNNRPAELLTQANRILGTGQLSLAKWLFIAADTENIRLSTKDEASFFRFILERFDPTRDLHFHTQTSIDTLDYSGEGLNTGSKLVWAACGQAQRSLGEKVPQWENFPEGFKNMHIAFNGALVLEGPKFTTYEAAKLELQQLCAHVPSQWIHSFPLITLCDDAGFTAAALRNWLWVTFTRSNPSHDVYGVDANINNKHWGCNGPVIIDARIKPFHAPAVEMPESILEKAKERLGKKL